jgi:sterol desaturase/sphingolipid hydroxylase (fatty acid hydroxylase superfamily)
MEYIVLSIPVFFLLIGIELWVSYRKSASLYRMNDAIANISCGIGQQVLGVFFKAFIFLTYVYLYEHFALLDIPVNPLTWFLLFLGVDFFYYWFHRLSHEINFIWATHIVHHQSEEYNFSVALRQSWFQGLISWVFYIPLAVLGFEPILIVTVAAFNTLYQFWIHTKLIDRMGPLEWVFNTPSHHRVHHGSNPKYIDKNHGGTLIIWDRLFGTFQAEEEEVVYGITKPIKSWNPVWANFHYWVELFQMARKAPTLMDKINTFIQPPGWRPESMGGREFAREVNIETYRKFDVAIPRELALYGLIQFLGLLFVTSFFLFTWNAVNEAGNPISVAVYIGMAAYIIFSIYSLGTGYEGRPIFYRNEIIRIVSIALLSGLGWGMQIYVLPAVIWIAFSGVSLLWLLSLHRKKILTWT